ncbi:MAG: hypothetical protein PVH77_10220 [Phycisphaerales bacterium]
MLSGRKKGCWCSRFRGTALPPAGLRFLWRKEHEEIGGSCSCLIVFSSGICTP